MTSNTSPSQDAESGGSSAMLKRVTAAVLAEYYAVATEAMAATGGVGFSHSDATSERIARAAIAAMREPTKEMEWAATGRHQGDGSLYGSIWTAMIDSALSKADAILGLSP